MNRIVRDNYPSEKLPDDLRELVDPSRAVRIVIEQPEACEQSVPSGQNATGRDALTRLAGRFGHKNVSAEEATARIRALRDEWDD